MRGSKIAGWINKEGQEKRRKKKTEQSKTRVKLKLNPIWREFAPPFGSDGKIRDEERQVLVAVTAAEAKVSGRQGWRECVLRPSWVNAVKDCPQTDLCSASWSKNKIRRLIEAGAASHLKLPRAAAAESLFCLSSTID